ncbi:hypothetical protein THRCLA_20443 [Thraustotheca clavata]|uniref:Uncharacterized protein n=1 Tax=Thraustotheca clavata TaxID=74557 RepID=A0A1W0A7A9_9STRA|nr:hypothetical protein THRCLA_20443 [Thraustotheca clavata]
MTIFLQRVQLTDDRKRHVRIIARLLNTSASKSSVPPRIVCKKLLRLAVKMEKQLFDATQGRSLTEKSIRKHLLFLASRVCKTKNEPQIASKSNVPAHLVSKKLLRLALKMEQKLFQATHGRKLSDTLIRKYLVLLFTMTSRTGLTKQRRQHIYIIARLLNESASKSSSLSANVVSKKLLRLAVKMEQKLNDVTKDLVLGEEAIRHHLVKIASGVCKKATTTPIKVQVVDTITEDRNRHIYIIARLLHNSAAKSTVPPRVISEKLFQLATKMEKQLYKHINGRHLGEDAIRKLLVQLAGRVCKAKAKVVCVQRSNLNEDRKRHVYVIARLLHSSASKASLPVQVVAKKLLGLAIKMEQQLFIMTHGRALHEQAIRKHLNMPIPLNRPMYMSEDRKRHIYIIARLLHSSATRNSINGNVMSKKVVRLAAKMEQQLYETTLGRPLTEDAIRYHLKYLAGRAFSARMQPQPSRVLYSKFHSLLEYIKKWVVSAKQ